MVTMPIRDNITGKLLSRKQRMDMINQVYEYYLILFVIYNCYFCKKIIMIAFLN